MSRRERSSGLSFRRVRRKLRELFGGAKEHDRRPPPRRHHLEQLLCEAIRQGRLVHLWNEEDLSPRIFAAYILFHARHGRIGVAGYQAALGGMRTFHLHRLKQIDILEDRFTPIANFDSSAIDGAKGIICSVEQARS